MEEDKEFNTVQRASEGDPEAFRELVERYGDRIFSLLTGITGNRLDAEELTSDVFLKAFTHLDRFRGECRFSTWLYRIAYNVFYDYLRTRKETDCLETRQVDAQCSTLQNDIGRRMDIYRALSMLKEMERTCITLFYMEDQSIEKIAGITGCPAGTVKSHLSRAKEKMATYLKQNGYDGKR